MQNLTISPLSTLPQVRVLGRCAGTDPLTLFWTGSGIELLFTGSELWVELRQHRTIPALRLKHRSGGCGTAPALPKCSIIHKVLSALLA